jgi:hypothetical protein
MALAGGAVNATHDHVEVGLYEPGRGGLCDAVVGRAVLDEELNGRAKQAALRIDVVDDHPRDVDIGGFPRTTVRRFGRL